MHGFNGIIDTTSEEVSLRARHNRGLWIFDWDSFFLCFLTQPSQSFIGIICLLGKYVNHYSLEPLLMEWLDN